MTQITEDYVSFETAKLLKEKGFDAECDYLYVDGELVRARGGACNWNKGEALFTDYKNECSAPTIQMAMKWLREVHNKSIEVRSQGLKATSIGWVVGIYNLRTQDEEYHHPYTFPTYEEACEAAIKYCLENLI